MISETITHPNGIFGYILPERRLGNYELQIFLELAGIGFRYALWHTRQDKSNPLLERADWCWQNYTVGYEYNIDGGQHFLSIFCAYLRMDYAAAFISCRYGRSSIQFTLTEEAERRILEILSQKNSQQPSW
jgi:hypothetical protein